MPEEDVTVSATLTPITYTITYSLDGGTLPEGYPESYNITSEAFKLTNPAKLGYTFTGWMLSGDTEGTASTDLTISTGSYGNKHYSASWEIITYTITYELDGGSVATANPTTYTVEDSFTLTNPTKKYYTFAGWTGTDIDEDETADTVTIPAGSTGNREYVATWAQHGFKPADEAKPQFAAYSMVLGGTLSVRFYVYLPDNNSADYVMQFDVSGDTSLNSEDCKPGTSIDSGDAKLYGYDCFINSAQMADKINAHLFKGTDTESIIDATYTAEDYLDTVSSNSTAYKDYELDLIEAIRDYGHFVQPMLSDANGWEIGVKYAYMDSDTKYSAESIDVVSGAVSNYKIVREPNSDIKEVKYSLSLGANTTLNFYIYTADGYTGSVAVDEGLTLEKLSATQYRVRFPGIAAHQLGDTKSFTVTTTSGSFTVSASALCYVNTVLALYSGEINTNWGTLASTNEAAFNEINGVVSLYRYYEATANYNDKKGGN